MDKLVQYIEGRIKRYGHIKSQQCVSSNYYTFGNFVVRISDHAKYGEDGIKQFDYGFIIQPNDLYLFTVSPKYNLDKTNKMYFKIVNLNEAKQFIRKLHDHSISLEVMCEIYSPEGWNCRGSNVKYDKPSWDDFRTTHVDNKDDAGKLYILDSIERLYLGTNKKGSIVEKLERVQETYDLLSMVQFEILIEKIRSKFANS